MIFSIAILIMTYFYAFSGSDENNTFNIFGPNYITVPMIFQLIQSFHFNFHLLAAYSITKYFVQKLSNTLKLSYLTSILTIDQFNQVKSDLLEMHLALKRFYSVIKIPWSLLCLCEIYSVTISLGNLIFLKQKTIFIQIFLSAFSVLLLLITIPDVPQKKVICFDSNI